MTDVFISYSRKDKEFVHQLNDALAAQNRNTWVDWEDIPATADWWKEIASGIEEADAFVFVISPDSVRSQVCRNEIDHAIANNKRFIPLLRREITDAADQANMPSVVSSHNWIYFRETDNFDNAFLSLANALDTDLGNVRTHTRLLVRAKEWETGNHDPSLLLQGDDLRKAELWLAQAVAKKPAPTPLHAQYITASRQAATNRQRRLLAGVSVALVISIALAILSLFLFGEANTQRGIADSKAATATFAQGQALQEADRANNNAATATIAQGKAEEQAVIAANNAATATVAQGQAQQQATAVSQERYTSQSIAMSGQSQVELDGVRPERAVILALSAFQIRATWQAERALAQAVEKLLEKRVLSGDTDIVTGVDWSPDGKRLVTSSNDGTARLWNLAGDQLAVLTGHEGAVTRALWSPDGSLIAASNADGTVQIWSVSDNNPKLLYTLTGHTKKINNLTWWGSRSGSREYDKQEIVTASDDGTAKIWDAEKGTLLFTLTGHKGVVNYAAFSPDGTRIATAGTDNTSKIWDATSGDLLFTLSGHKASVIRVVWKGDNTQVATASADNTVKVWDAATGQEVFTLVGHIRQVTRVAWSPDNTYIATASADATAKIWNAADGSVERTLFGHEAEVNGLEWSPGGSRLITVSSDGTAKIWYTESGGLLLTFRGHIGTIYSLNWSPDGNYFATAGADHTARIWQIWRNAQALITFSRKCCVPRTLTDEENIQFGLSTATPAPSPTPAPASCTSDLPSRLYPGARGRVTSSDTDTTAVSVRRGPATTYERIGRVSPGQTFQVVSGPTCGEGMAWFEVLYGIGAVRGWLAEGQAGVYFVEPIYGAYDAGG
ncbi:MAG: TIR domain-containing protein [Anaerolineaceae bacterium]|nr:TIR domain-containing protein [Anaerolineaceae bacterium]